MAPLVPFRNVRKTLELNGWKLDRVRGSHHIFKRPGHCSIVIPVHRGKVKPAYVRNVEKTIRKAQAEED